MTLNGITKMTDLKKINLERCDDGTPGVMRKRQSIPTFSSFGRSDVQVQLSQAFVIVSSLNMAAGRWIR